MRKYLPTWLIGLAATLGVIGLAAFLFWPRTAKSQDDPIAGLPVHRVHTSHAELMPGPYQTGQDVTRACLDCHPDAAAQVMKTTHWTWESQPFNVPWRDEPVTIGKINQVNNFCIGAQGNEKKCMTCHPGYGWSEETEYDFANALNVDCLACHAETSAYAKGEFGNPAEGIDLAAAAQSVRNPTRDNCGTCHFNGGGGNGVKHGDLDESLYFPSESLDVHMGREDFLCTDCHQTQEHAIRGRIMADNYTIDPAEQVACTDCHAAEPHNDERLNTHLESVACQTCHIPAMAVKDPTKTYWDWSTSGQDIPEDHYTYLKIKGSFEYQRDFKPTYAWWNGNLDYRYLLGDPLAESGPTYIDRPAGDIQDANSRIFPFKVHVAKQPYDPANNYLLQPITGGTGGYWSTFDWDSAFQMAEEQMGLDYSGQYDFAETWMYWPTSHMIQPKEGALQCADCHSPEGRLTWEALGYPGDPMEWGGRFSNP